MPHLHDQRFEMLDLDSASFQRRPIWQRLAVLAIELGRAESSAAGGAQPQVLKTVREGLVRLSEDIHSLAYRLHPAVLEELGLRDEPLLDLAMPGLSGEKVLEALRRSRPDLPSEHLARMAERMLDRAEHLRHAAHRVGVLHALAVLVAPEHRQPSVLLR